MIALTCALVTAGILSMFFANTRCIGIICITVLCFLYPIPVISSLVAAGIFYYFKTSKK